MPFVQQIKKLTRPMRLKFRYARQSAVRMSSRTFSLLSVTNSSEAEKGDDLEANTLPVHIRDGYGLSPVSRNTEPFSPVSPEPTSPVTIVASPVPASEPPSQPASPGSPRGKQLWRNAINTLKVRSAVSSAMAVPLVPHRQRTTSSTVASTGERRKTLQDEPVKSVLRSRVSVLSPKLRCLEPTQDLAAHQALVRHLQFSPDGRFLATSG